MSEAKDEKSFEAEVEAEKKKISELFRELKNKESNGQNDDKLNWMYKNPSENVEREEYLLGRSVDKALDTLTGKDSTTSNELANFPKRVVNKEGNNSEQVESHKKIHEDPLFAMKQREIAAKKELLNNPLKVKELKKMVEMETKKKEKFEKIQYKEERKRRKDERVNYLLIKQLGKLQNKIDVKLLLNELSNTDTDSSEEDSRKYKKNKKPSRRKRKDSSETSSTDNESDSESDERSRNRSKSGKKIIRPKKDKKRRQSLSSSSEEESRKPSKNKKNTSNKKRKNKRDSPSNSSSDSDTKSRLKKYGKSHKRRASTSSEESTPNTNKKKKKFAHYTTKSKSRKHNSSNSSEESSLDIPRKSNTKKTSHSTFKSKPRKRKSSNTSEDSSLKRKISSKRKIKETNDNKPKTSKQHNHKKRKNDDSESEEDDRLRHTHSSQKPYGLSMLDGSKPDKTAKKVAVYKKEETKKVSTEQQKARVISEKERDDELKKMMKNAKWRKDEREADYAKHKLVKQKEDKLETYDESFIKNQMAILSNSGSMADRVKSKMNTVQRSGTTMDQSFVRK